MSDDPRNSPPYVTRTGRFKVQIIINGRPVGCDDLLLDGDTLWIRTPKHEVQGLKLGDVVEWSSWRKRNGHIQYVPPPVIEVDGKKAEYELILRDSGDPCSIRDTCDLTFRRVVVEGGGRAEG